MVDPCCFAFYVIVLPDTAFLRISWGSFFYLFMLLCSFYELSICVFPLFVPISVSFVYAWYIYILPGLFFSLFFFLCLGYIIFLYLFCFFLLFCFSILREVPLPLLLVHGPSPHNLHRCGLACVSASSLCECHTS